MTLIPGVPPLLIGTIASAAITLLTSDLISALGLDMSSKWGIYLAGEPVVIADTVTSIEYKKDSHISDYPIEGGIFESYNKQAQPFDARVTFVSGGSDENRAALLELIAEIVDDYNLYDVVTPEIVYQSCNIVHHDYRRTVQNGRGIIAVTVWLKQVRISTTSGGSTTAQPDGANAENGGSVQTMTPSSAQSTAATGIQ